MFHCKLCLSCAGTIPVLLSAEPKITFSNSISPSVWSGGQACGLWGYAEYTNALPVVGSIRVGGAEMNPALLDNVTKMGAMQYT